MAYPGKKPEDRRTTVLRVAVTPAQAERIRAKALGSDFGSVSSWLRAKAQARLKSKPRPTKPTPWDAHRLRVCVTHSESVVIFFAAARWGMDVSTWLRAVAVSAAGR